MDKPEPSCNINSKNETARDLRKRNKRLKASRNGLQEKGRQQAETVKALKGKADDLKTSRDLWKKRCNQEAEEKKRLTIELKANKTHIEELSIIAQERERLLKIKDRYQEEDRAKYEKEIAELKKKLMK
jgi:erythromycin esterase-like protein